MDQRSLPCQDFLFSAGIVINNKIYLFTEKENIFMTIDMKNWEMKYLDRFTGYNLYCGRTDKLLIVNNKLYKLALDGKYIEEFFLKSEEYQRIELGYYDKPWDNFVAFESEGQFLFVFLKWKNQVIKINVNNHKIEKIELRITEKDEYINTKFTKYSFAYRHESEVWLFEIENNRIDIYDMKKNEIKFFIFQNKIGESLSISNEGEKFYLLTSKNQVYIWNYKKNSLALLWGGEEYYGKKYYFGEILCIQQKIILLPTHGEDIVVFDCKNRKAEVVNEYPEGFHYFDIRWGKYINCFQDEKYYYYPMRTSEYLLAINKSNGQIFWRELKTPSKKEKAIYLQKQYVNRYGIMLDNPGGIEFLLNSLEVKKKKEEELKNRKKLIGYQVWKYVKG